MWRVTAPGRQQVATPDVRVARLAAEEWSVLSIAELRACGLYDHAVARRRRDGHLHLVFRGVYVAGQPGLSMQGLFLAAVKACGPNAALSHFSAATLWGLLPWDPERPPDVIVPANGSRGIPGIKVHRTRRPPIVRRFDRIPVTLPARALADLSSMLQFDAHRRAVREAMALKRVTVKELLAETQTAQLRKILADGYTPTRSELEDAVLDLLAVGGFGKPDVNAPLYGFVPDFRWPAERLIIEADSKEWHDNPIRRQDDADRQAILEAQGERVLRVTWAQAVGQPQQTLARIQRAGAPRTC